MLTETQVRKVRPLRHSYKLADSGGLYLLVVPNGGRYWRYNYRFNGKHKTIALGTYPDVALARARVRHQVARQYLADGIDPGVEKATCKSLGPPKAVQARQFAQLFYAGGAREARGQCDVSDVSATERPAKLAV